MQADKTDSRNAHKPNGNALSRKLGYVFKQPELLQRALTHRSYAAGHNERLEFLGDAILGCIIAKHLYSNYPQLSEGELSRLRSNLVREETLATLARQLDLGSHLKLGEGELKSGGFRRPSILADALESLFGAVFLDADFAASERVVLSLYVPYLEQMDVENLGKDAKTLLQEYLQGKHMPLPGYNVIAMQGEAHEQSFEVECVIPSARISSRGSGTTRRNAEQQAAQAAYQQLTAAK